MNFSYSDSEDDELEVVVDGYGGHESFNNEEEMVDDDGSEPEGGENSHHDLDRLRGRGDPRVEEDSETDVTVTPPAAGEEAHEQVNDVEELNKMGSVCHRERERKIEETETDKKTGKDLEKQKQIRNRTDMKS